MDLKMSWARDAALRMQAQLSGQLRGSAALSELLGQLLFARACLPFTSDEERLDALLKACRRMQLAGARSLLEGKLRPYLTGSLREVARRRKVGWERYASGFGSVAKKRPLTTSLVLKAPRPGGEKGVLYCSFEYNWLGLVAHHDAAAVLEDYYLVGASSSSPNNYAALAAFAGLSADPIFIGISNPVDLEHLALMRPVIEPVALMASDWIDPSAYAPKPHRARGIDILMVASWARVKRHWLLFEALRDMPRHLRVVLVGRDSPGRTQKEILEEARAFGVPQQLELYTSLEFDEVAKLQCDARISAIFSLREGSCVATAESLFADSPVAMMKGAHVGSRAYINSQTGVLLTRRGMARDLRRFWEESERYTPRQWALQNISCTRSSEHLNTVLRNWALRTGRPWTEDIAPLCWRYVPAYLDPADEARLLPAVEELKRKHGVELEKFPGERASLLRQGLNPPPPPNWAAALADSREVARAEVLAAPPELRGEHGVASR